MAAQMQEQFLSRTPVIRPANDGNHILVQTLAYTFLFLI